MDGFPYKNWDKDRDSFDETPPARGGMYGFRDDDKSDDYDFEISGGDQETEQGMVQDRRPAAYRRKSTDERMQEILKVARDSTGGGLTPPGGGIQGAPVQSSIQSSWDDLVQDLDEIKGDFDPMDTSNVSVSLSEADSPLAVGKGTYEPSTGGGRVRGGQHLGKQGDRTTEIGTSFGEGSDSFDISEGDFEVGTYAAAMAKEKTAERRRRSANLDPGILRGVGARDTVSPSKAAAITDAEEILTSAKTGAKPSKMSVSPEVRSRRAPVREGLLGSTALSSIDKNDADAYEQDVGEGGTVRYGSLDQSDDNLYAALAQTNTGQGNAPVRNAPARRAESGVGARYSESSVYSSERSSLDFPLTSAKRENNEDGVDEDYGSDDFDGDDSPGEDGAVGGTSKANDSAAQEAAKPSRRISFEDIKARWLAPNLSSDNLVAKASISAAPAHATPVDATLADATLAESAPSQAIDSADAGDNIHNGSNTEHGTAAMPSFGAESGSEPSSEVVAQDSEGVPAKSSRREDTDSVMMRSLDTPDLPVYSPGTHTLRRSGFAPAEPGSPGPPPPPPSSSSRDDSALSQQSSASASLIALHDGQLPADNPGSNAVPASIASSKQPLSAVKEEQSESQSGALDGLAFIGPDSSAPAPSRAAPLSPIPVSEPQSLPLPTQNDTSTAVAAITVGASGSEEGRLRTYFDGVFHTDGENPSHLPEPEPESEMEPMGAPVDLASLGFNSDLSKSSKVPTSDPRVSSSRAQGSTAPESRAPPEWPTALPVMAPSAAELSASLTMLRARQKGAVGARGTPGSVQAARRITANTRRSGGDGNRVTRAQPRGAGLVGDSVGSKTSSAASVSSSSTRQQRPSAIPTKAPLSREGSVSSDRLNNKSEGKGLRKPSPLRVEKDEQSTARLAKQFESLEKQMLDLRKMQGVVKNGKSPSRITVTRPNSAQTPSVATADVRSASVAPNLGCSVNSNTSATASAPSREGVGKPITPSRSTSPPTAPTGRSSRKASSSTDGWLGSSRDGATFEHIEGRSWDDQAMDTIMKVVVESAQLEQKERELADREEAVKLRESLADGANLQTRLSPVKTKVVDASEFAFPARLPELTTSERAAASRVLPHELVANYSEREQTLLREIETLKAHLSDLKQSNIAAFPATKKIASAAQAQEVASQNKAEEDGMAPVEVDGMIHISAKDLQKLHVEIESQEVLITGYQKENEKLVARVKELESAEQTRITKFIEQQEVLNKEVNRLRNTKHASDDMPVSSIDGKEDIMQSTHGSSSGNMKRSAAVLQQELEAAALVRNMKERLGEEKAAFALREKELKTTIEKLRGENRQLITEHRFGTAGDRRAMEDVAAAVAEERRGYAKEMSELRSKLAWYAENQDLLDKGEDEKKHLRETLLALRKELRRVKCGGGGGTDEDPDASLVTVRARATTARHPGDIKRIKELETTVKDLQDSLQKRHPDSVSSLIRAATVSESVEARQTARDKEVAILKREAHQAKEEMETRLRGLRQEHESVRVRYENRLRNLTDELARARNSNYTSSEGVTSGSPPRNTQLLAPAASKQHLGESGDLAAANSRVRELEDELERVRAFYTKKVEETRRVALNQIAVFKRKSSSPGSSSVGAGLASTPEVLPRKGQPPAPHTPMSELLDTQVFSAEDAGGVPAHPLPVSTPPTFASPSQRASIAALRAQFQQRVDLLEEELMKVATELGKVRAEKAKDRASTAATTQQELVVAKENIHQLETMLAELQKQLDVAQDQTRSAELQAQTQVSAGSSAASPRSPRVGGGTVGPTEHSPGRTDMLLAQLEAMEQHVVSIETRFLRRERELESLVEDTRATSKVERARLAALHAAELHDKDEQLLRFKSELEVLVAALKAHSLGQQEEAHRVLEEAAAAQMRGGMGHLDAATDDAVSLSLTQLPITA